MAHNTVVCTAADQVIPALLAAARPTITSEGRHTPQYLFRGHALADDWALLATLCRDLIAPDGHPHGDIESLAHRQSSPEEAQTGPEAEVKRRQRWVAYLLSAARDELFGFASLAGELDLLHGAAAAEATAVMNSDHNWNIRTLHQTSPALAGLAQHHGLRTMFLDWSTNPLVALWFACRDVVAIRHLEPYFDAKDSTTHSHGRGDLQSDWACVWIVPTFFLHSHERIKLHFVLDQAFSRSQSGVFTYDRQATEEFIAYGTIQTLDKFFSDDEKEARPYLVPTCVKFPHALVPQVLSGLARQRITSAHLMPSLANVANMVRTSNQQTP